MDIYIRQATTDSLRETAFALRYKAFFRSGGIEEQSEPRFVDQLDELPNQLSYLLYDGNEKAIGSIRAMVKADAFPGSKLTALNGYAEELAELGSQAVIVESSRFCLDPDWRGNSRHAQIALFRMILANAFTYSADYVVTATRIKHAAFYERVMQFRTISQPKSFPGVNYLNVLLAAEFQQWICVVQDKIPSFKMSPKEAREWSLDSAAR